VDNLPDNELIMTDKKNIYGDFRICYKCGMNADVVESGKDYCASCWFVNHTDMTIDEYERKNKDLEKERFRINYKKDKK
jgi:ribosomal protein L37E